ncbi:MAG: hypothetical protein AUK44_02205 [Porphyromonadaceae bacterium CG2_30_38_12]|nr:MAG: hypothetical protein AUK44_02205 [Porphyromonadaceae bacterium CG2_30_38_12]
MIALLIILVAFGGLLFIITYLNRRNKNEESEITLNENGECCGAHAVCDKESLLASDDKIEYFDDEELDALACKSPAEYTDTQISQLADVFYTLKENEVAAWLRSLQKRRIELPVFLRDEALLVVTERRNVS